MRSLEVEHRLGGRLLTTDAWAGYVIYKYWPEQHVFFDDRYDMYPIAMTQAYNKVLGLKPGWERARPVPDQPGGLASRRRRAAGARAPLRLEAAGPTRSPRPSSGSTRYRSPADPRSRPDPHGVWVSRRIQGSHQGLGVPGGRGRPSTLIRPGDRAASGEARPRVRFSPHGVWVQRRIGRGARNVPPVCPAAVVLAATQR